MLDLLLCKKLELSLVWECSQESFHFIFAEIAAVFLFSEFIAIFSHLFYLNFLGAMLF